jgi:predicted RNase H-like HicB family nuclease
LTVICYNALIIARGGNMSTYKFSVVIEKDSDGYFAFSPELQGCYTQGDTYEEALENIKDAIRLHVEDRLESGEEIPQSESVSLTLMEIAV